MRHLHFIPQRSVQLAWYSLENHASAIYRSYILFIVCNLKPGLYWGKSKSTSRIRIILANSINLHIRGRVISMFTRSPVTCLFSFHRSTCPVIKRGIFSRTPSFNFFLSGRLNASDFIFGLSNGVMDILTFSNFIVPLNLLHIVAWGILLYFQITLNL